MCLVQKLSDMFVKLLTIYISFIYDKKQKISAGRPYIPVIR